MKKIVNLACAFSAFVLLFACSSGDEVQSSDSIVKDVQKTQKMIDFEAGFKGISARMAVSPEAQERVEVQIVEKSRKYLESNGAIVQKEASRSEIVRQALLLHGQKVNELRNNKKQ